MSANTLLIKKGGELLRLSVLFKVYQNSLLWELHSFYNVSCNVNTACGDAEIEVSEQLYIDFETKGDTLPTDCGFVGAVDIGTTTVCAAITSSDGAKVYKRKSALNPEGIFGADVLSRIQAASEGKLSEMQSMICKRINEMLLDMTEGKSLEKLYVTANTTMLHIFMGVDPSSIGIYPFEPKFCYSLTVNGSELGISASEITLLPSASGYIGADVVGGAVALGMYNGEETRLLVDIGTNGEIIIAHNGEYHALSAAAGPALEGASIECGTGAVKGSISSVELKAGELLLSTIGDGAPVGISGSGLIDIISILVSEGIIDETGAFDYDSESPLSAKLVEGRFYITKSVYLSDADVRQFQLAKAAICAALETLLDTLKIGADEVSEVYVAGGLGTYTNMENAARVGLIPGNLLKKAKAVGNSALLGALLCARSDAALLDMSSLSEKVRILELSSSEIFNTKFMDNMFFSCR